MTAIGENNILTDFLGEWTLLIRTPLFVPILSFFNNFYDDLVVFLNDVVEVFSQLISSSTGSTVVP